MRTWLVAACAALLAAGGAAAADRDDGGRARNWALGWEEGVTLRRTLGAWDVGVSAGPSDWLDDRDSYGWNEEWPDSLQGRATRGDETRRESGFVRLGCGRELTRWREFSLHATLAGQYTWINRQDRNRSYRGEPGPDIWTNEVHEDAWRTDLGLRIAWLPVPFLGIQVRYGLRLESATGTETTTDYDASDDSWSGSVSPYKDIRFDDYGPSGTYSFEFFAWF